MRPARIVKAGGRVIFKVGAHQRALLPHEAAALRGTLYRKGYAYVTGIPGREYALTLLCSRANAGAGAAVVLREVFPGDEDPAYMGVGRMSDEQMDAALSAALDGEVRA